MTDKNIPHLCCVISFQPRKPRVSFTTFRLCTKAFFMTLMLLNCITACFIMYNEIGAKHPGSSLIHTAYYIFCQIYFNNVLLDHWDLVYIICNFWRKSCERHNNKCLWHTVSEDIPGWHFGVLTPNFEPVCIPALRMHTLCVILPLGGVTLQLTAKWPVTSKC